MRIAKMGTMSYRKPDNFLIGALELVFQVLSQHPQKFLTEFLFVAQAVYLHAMS